MKKIFLLTLICMLSLTFVACGQEEKEKEITAEEIEQDELFQNVLLQTSMMRSEPMTVEERVDFMLQLYRNTFEPSVSLLKVTYYIDYYCKGAISLAFDDAPKLINDTQKHNLINLLKEPLLNAYEYWYCHLTEEPEVDFDSLIPELREKALEILK